MVYITSLATLSESVRNAIGYEHGLSPSDRWTELAYNSNVGGYVKGVRKPLEFEVGDHVMLKVSPWKGVVHFGKKGKLAPRYVGPFEVLERIGPVAYWLRLPEELSGVHDTFHVSTLKKCLAYASLHVPLNEIKVDKTLRFIEEPAEILDRKVKSSEEKRYKADIRATNILLQGIPKDIYLLINHYTDAKDIWENVKMILEGSELTKDDRESQLYDEFEHFRQIKGEIIHGYYVM
ncbi:hypothetical protein Tco_1179070 [Tanacetum coccineum]